MRTTLDIDDELLAVARERARQRGISLGDAVSELMRQGLRVPTRPAASGFPVFTPPPGTRIVTDDLVRRFRDDDGPADE